MPGEDKKSDREGFIHGLNATYQKIVNIKNILVISTILNFFMLAIVAMILLFK